MQNEFIQRVNIFLRFMRFQTDSGQSVSLEVQIILASAAIQLTFGLRHFVFEHFKRIIIKAAPYKISDFNETMLGHVDRNNRTITLSWPNVLYGFEVTDDAHNVVLHELAHVILFENSLRLTFKEFFARPHWEHWLYHAEDRFSKNQNRRNILLAEYADKNLQEMFAVSVETFFEQSERFKKTLPGLYASLVTLFRQDPCRMPNPRL